MDRSERGGHPSQAARRARDLSLSMFFESIGNGKRESNYKVFNKDTHVRDLIM
jgi:hypothetical protein